MTDRWDIAELELLEQLAARRPPIHRLIALLLRADTALTAWLQHRKETP